MARVPKETVGKTIDSCSDSWAQTSLCLSLSHTPLRLSFPSIPLTELFSPGGRGVFPAWGFSASRQSPVRWYSPLEPGSLWRETFVLPSLDLEHASPGPATWEVCPGCSVNGSVSRSIRLLWAAGPFQHSNLYPGFIKPSQCPETASKEHGRWLPLQLVPPGASRHSLLRDCQGENLIKKRKSFKL